MPDVYFIVQVFSIGRRLVTTQFLIGVIIIDREKSGGNLLFTFWQLTEGKVDFFLLYREGQGKKGSSQVACDDDVTSCI